VREESHPAKFSARSAFVNQFEPSDKFFGQL
jgi:hypothetical protein